MNHWLLTRFSSFWLPCLGQKRPFSCSVHILGPPTLTRAQSAPAPCNSRLLCRPRRLPLLVLSATCQEFVLSYDILLSAGISLKSRSYLFDRWVAKDRGYVTCPSSSVAQQDSTHQTFGLGSQLAFCCAFYRVKDFSIF